NKILKPEYDAARQNRGGSWRMPTQQEFNALMNDCAWEWTTEGDHNGYKVTDDYGNSIFLPAAGYYEATSLYSVGEYGFYWSSSLYTNSSRAYYLNSANGIHRVVDSNRYGGQSVRPVKE
ncbi:MAG: hypothetical protein Q4E55_04295, partial [Bacteroidales bacterium]|nr:hypothetical protein [Bacteroidales bacterium]